MNQSSRLSWKWRSRGYEKESFKGSSLGNRILGLPLTVVRTVRRKMEDDEFHFGWMEVQVGKLGGEYSQASIAAGRGLSTNLCGDAI